MRHAHTNCSFQREDHPFETFVSGEDTDAGRKTAWFSKLSGRSVVTPVSLWSVSAERERRRGRVVHTAVTFF